MSQVPGVRKKLSPMVVLESAGTVRARFSKVNSPNSGDQVIVGGRSTAAPGAIWTSTLLSWKPSPETGAAYHQFKSQAFHPGWTSTGSKYDPSPTSFPVTRLSPRARIESAIASTAVNAESHAPGPTLSTQKHRSDQVGSPRPYNTRSPYSTPLSTRPFGYTLVVTR